MYKNYLKIAWRNILKNKVFSVINSLGLAIGLACCFLILLFIKYEIGYDTFHEKSDRIYRLNYGADFASDGLVIASAPPPIAPLMVDNFSEVERVARRYRRQVSVSVKDPNGNAVRKHEVLNQYFADSSILDIFTFDFISGNTESALDVPTSIVITDEMALLFFGTTDALGKTLYMEDVYPFTVTGVVKKYPANSHIEFTMIAPYEDMYSTAPLQTRESMRASLANNWIISHSYTYVLLKPNAIAANVDRAFRDFLNRFGNPQVRDGQNFTLIPLRDIHLFSTAGSEPTPTANVSFLYIFLAIGFITLLIAGINFVNFSTAGSLGRAKEVGVRKVMGARKASIVGQFLGESMLLSLISLILSFAFVVLALPHLSNLTNRELDLVQLSDVRLIGVFIGIYLLAGLLAGAYPAFFASRFSPISILKGSGVANTPNGTIIRKALITIQFVATIALIGGTIGIYNQLKYLQEQPMGFQSDYIVNVPLFSQQLNSIFGGVGGDIRQRMNSFEAELMRNPKISSVTASSAIPSIGAPRRNIQGEHITAEDNLFMICYSVDYDFLDTYELELVAGRSFGKEYGSDHLNAFVLNETAVADMKWSSPEDAIGKQISREGKNGTVVGVVKDFHQTSLHQPILPVAMDVNASAFNTFSIKVDASDITSTLSSIENKWDQFFPQKVFEYTFLNESISNLYQAEDRLGKIIANFALIAILISCFGLYGLVALAATQKTKEIGIRKVLGSSVLRILTLLSKEFMILILIAGLFAIPITYFGLNKWLEDYPYNVGVGLWLIIVPMLCVLIIALTTISFRTVRAAMANPIDSLRTE